MHWEWVVPVIFLIVWIISSLIQGTERERTRTNRPRSLPGGERPPGERTLRRPPSDIDRFLEEVNRRRRQAAERSAPPASRERPPIPAASLAPAPSRPRVAQRPTGGRPAVPPARLPSGKIPEALPVMETAAAAEVMAVASALQAAPVSNLAPPPTTAGTDGRAPTANA